MTTPPSPGAPTIELGGYSFGDAPRHDDGSVRPSHEAVQNLLAQIQHGDRTGLDYFAVGEHHTAEMPGSSPGAVISAAAASTEQITLSSGSSIISTDDPVRVFQQFAIADAVSGGGRVEIVAGRGSSVESFPLFGHSLDDYDTLYEDKLDLLLAINDAESTRVTWSGRTRPALENVEVVPRPVAGRLPIWRATGGNPGSSVRAGQAGVPVSFGIIGGQPKRFAPLAELYRRAAEQAGHPARTGRGGDGIKVAVATLGLVAPTKQEALERFYPGWYALNLEMGKLRGWAPPQSEAFIAQAHGDGAYFIGDPDDVAERIVELHRHLGHVRHTLQMDVGGVAHEHVLESVELLATEVKPRVERLLARER